MRHTDLVNAVEALVDATCADSVKDALAAVCAAKMTHYPTSIDADEYYAWERVSHALNAIDNFGV